MRLTGGKSGFRTTRDLLFFTFGLGIDLFHIINTPSDDLSIPLLIFGAAVAGVPSFLRYDERYEDQDDDNLKKRRSKDRESDE